MFVVFWVFVSDGIVGVLGFAVGRVCLRWVCFRLVWVCYLLLFWGLLRFAGLLGALVCLVVLVPLAVVWYF